MIRAATRAIFHGIKDYGNRYTPWVFEFMQRRRLAELGFTSDLSKLSLAKADAFCVIDMYSQELLAKARTKKSSEQKADGR